MKKNRTVFGAFCGLMTGICWGVSGVFGQFLFETRGVETAWLVPIRLVVAGILLLIYLFFSRREAGGMSIVDFRKIQLKYGMTVHDVNELADAKREKVPFICASNIFETSCKPGVKPRGLDFLRETAKEFGGPVYALGGINTSNAASCIEAGADGVAVRSLCMKDDLSDLREIIAM